MDITIQYEDHVLTRRSSTLALGLVEEGIWVCLSVCECLVPDGRLRDRHGQTLCNEHCSVRRMHPSETFKNLCC